MKLASLLLALTQTAAPSPASPSRPGPPVVLMQTSLGDLRIELNPAKAPLTVENFLAYVRSGHYDGTTFHRVMPGFMIQGGGFGPDLEPRPTRPPIRNEARNGLRNFRGTVAMARTRDPNSATAQFFINLRNNPRLDYGMGGAGYAVFGKVVAGMRVVDEIAKVRTHSRGRHRNVPSEAVVIRKISEVPAAP